MKCDFDWPSVEVKMFETVNDDDLQTTNHGYHTILCRD